MASSGSRLPGSPDSMARWPYMGGLPVEIVASGIGAAVCCTFVLSPESPDTPPAVVAGMVLTNLCCPLLFFAASSATYRRHRTAAVALARLLFMQSTVWVSREARSWQAGDMPWPSLLLSLLYSSRTLVVGSWGAFGWQLPMAWHAALQLMHVSLAAWRLAPAVCLPGEPLRANAGKLQTLAVLMDWPLRAVGGPALLMPPAGACLALVIWTQFTFGFVLPTGLLLAIQRRCSATHPPPRLVPAAGVPTSSSPAARQAPPAPAPVVEEPTLLWPACFVGAQLLWLSLRVALHDATAE